MLKKLSTASNNDLETAFSKISSYCQTTSNQLVKEMLLDSLKRIAKEICVRDKTKYNDFLTFFMTLEMVDKKGSTEADDVNKR